MNPFVKRDKSSRLVDLICKRYPNTKPSDYLGIYDDYTAFQVDSALALSGETRDKEFIVELVESIQDYLVGVMQSMGAKVKPRPRRHRFNPARDDSRPLNEILQSLGGQGTVIEKGLNNGTS